MAGGGAGSIEMTRGGVGRSRRASQAEQMPWTESMTGRADVAAKLVGYADGFPLFFYRKLPRPSFRLVKPVEEEATLRRNVRR